MKRGFLTIHSCPMALVRHVEWAIENTLGKSASNQMNPIKWRVQPLVAGTQRMQIEWRSDRDLAAELASALKSWHYLRFEITSESELFRFTPELGLHRANIDQLGSVLITENQVKFAMSKTDDLMRETLNVALGTEWEVALEQFRGVDLQEVAQLRAI